MRKMENMEVLSTVLVIILIIVCVVLMKIKSYLDERKEKNINKLKGEGTGIVKKTRVSAVKKGYIPEKSGGYYLYWLESKDESGNTYESGSFKDADHGGCTKEEMKVKYDGVDYDLSDKDNALRELNDNKHRLEMELQDNPGFLKKRELKKDIKAMEKYIEIANEGLVTPYLICNGHKVSVGDTIDVFVDPDKPEEYYFDLDFTNEN